MILCNENGAIASPALPDDGIEIVSEIFGLPVGSYSIVVEDVVGSLGVANNHGVLLHPDVLPDEVLLIEEVLGVTPMVGTVAFGSP